MELHQVAIRALFAYVALLALVRVSGKRTISQATPFALVLSLVLGDMSDDALWAEVPAAKFVAATGTLCVTHLVVSWLAWRSEWVDRLVGSSPAKVISDGKPLGRALRGERMNEKELRFEVRHHGLEREDWDQVQSAHVEPSGTVSVLRQAWARTAQKRDAEAVRRRRKH
jgi:uncharacterized membrane protein YcaP (DUF421 family)